MLHLQWLAAPELDARLFRPHLPAVFTAHDLLPRRTARRSDLWRRAARPLRARRRAHRERPRDARGRSASTRAAARRAPSGLPERPAAHRRRPHRPLLRRHPPVQGPRRCDRGGAPRRRRAAARRGRPARADRAVPRGRAGLDVEWRLGYLSPAEVDRAFGDATIALFPYRPELDQSGALLRALGAGVPAVAYDVGGVAEPVRRFGAGRVVPPATSKRSPPPSTSCSRDPAALEEARAGARRAREELTWDAAARAHLEIYEEIA